jgi:hypothetical protein
METQKKDNSSFEKFKKKEKIREKKPHYRLMKKKN